MELNRACKQSFIYGDFIKELCSGIWTVNIYTGKKVDIEKPVKRKPICNGKAKFKRKNSDIITNKAAIEMKITKNGTLSFMRIEKGKYTLQCIVGGYKEKNPRYNPAKTKIVTYYDKYSGLPYEVDENPDPEYLYQEGELQVSDINVRKGEDFTLKILDFKT